MLSEARKDRIYLRHTVVDSFHRFDYSLRTRLSSSLYLSLYTFIVARTFPMDLSPLVYINSCALWRRRYQSISFCHVHEIREIFFQWNANGVSNKISIWMLSNANNGLEWSFKLWNPTEIIYRWYKGFVLLLYKVFNCCSLTIIIFVFFQHVRKR